MSDRNTQLMKEMGSKTGRYDPEPPAQWQWQLENGTPAERLLAWVKSKTTAFGHHSAFCVDEKGNALYLEHAAADLGWSLHTTQNIASQLNAQDRIRLNKNSKRIYFRAEIKPEKPMTEDGRNLGEIPILYNGNCPTYVIDFIQSLPPEKKEVFVREYDSFVKWQDGVLADAVAAARAVIAKVEDTMLERHGIDKKRLPERRKPKAGGVQLELLEYPDFVQSNGYGDSYTGKGRSVQPENAVRTNGASLLTSDADNYTDKEGEEKARTKPPSPPPVVQAEESGNNGTAVMLAKAAADPDALDRFEAWRAIRNRSKKPVPDENLSLRRQCFEVFSAYPAAEQQRIITDTAARIDSWNAEQKLQFIPDALKYLKDAPWRTDPVQYVEPKKTRADRVKQANEKLWNWAETGKWGSQ